MTKHLRIALLALATASAGVAPLIAQDGPPPPPASGQQGGPRGGGGNPAEMQAKQLERMTKELSLTPDQVTSIKAIQADGMQKMQALRDDASTTGPDRRTKMMAMRADQTAKIKAVLTPDQKVKFDAMEERNRERRPRPDGQGAPPAPPTPPSN